MLFVKQKLNNAEWFISAINQRNSTIKKVMKSIIKKQSQYFDSDKRIIIPIKIFLNKNYVKEQ